MTKTTISRGLRRMLFGLGLESWNSLMLLSLAFAAFAALAILITTRAVIILQGQEAKDNAEAFARYKLQTEEKISEATARQKEAELKLEQLRRQISLRIVQREAFLKAIEGQPRARVEILYLEILYLRDDPECFDVAQQFWQLLQEAKWEVTAPTPIPNNFTEDAIRLGPTSMLVSGEPSGVTVAVHSISKEEANASMNEMQGKDWVKTPFTVLQDAIGQVFGRVGGRAGGPNAPPTGMLRIIVAPAPKP